MRKQQFQVGDQQVRCVPEPERVVKTGLKRARRVELPARTEVIMTCKPTTASSWLQRTAAVAKPCSNQWCYAEDGIVIASALKTPEDVGAFLGLASYYRRYIPGFSTVATPMINLT